MKAQFWLFVLMLFLLHACKPETDLPQIPISFASITPLDINAQPMGDADSSDWSLDVLWPVKIYSAFPFPDTLNYSDAATVSNLQMAAYPNPTDSIANLDCYVTDTTIIKFIIVDTSFKILMQSSVKYCTGMNNIKLNLSDSMFLPGKYYRMYYAFYDYNKSIYFKGHGDIKKN